MNILYGGTKEEMERLLADAEKLSGLEFDISSYADVTEAIHIIQESMGVAGATAMEAEGTISGSVAALQAAWENFLVGMGDSNADLSKLAGDVVKQFEIVGENVLPVIDEIVGNIPGIKVAGPALASVAAGIVAFHAATSATKAVEAFASGLAKAKTAGDAAKKAVAALAIDTDKNTIAAIKAIAAETAATTAKLKAEAVEKRKIATTLQSAAAKELERATTLKGAAADAALASAIGLETQANAANVVAVTAEKAAKDANTISTAANKAAHEANAASMTLGQAAIALFAGKLDIATAKTLLFNGALGVSPIVLIATAAAAAGVAIYGMTNAIVDSVPALAEAEKKLNDVAKANKDYIDTTKALIDEQADVNDTYEEVSERYDRQSAQIEENINKLAELESTSEKTRGQEQERIKTIKDLNKAQDELIQKLGETEAQLAGFPSEAERAEEAIATLADEYGYSGEEIEAELARLNMSHEEWAAMQEKSASSASDAIQEYAIKTGGSYAEIEAAVKQSGLTAEEWVARQEDAYKRAQEALAAYTDGATQLFGRINTNSEQSIEQVTGNLDANAAAVDQYAQDLLALEGKIDQELFATLQEQGPEKAAATARMLAAASETELKAFDTAYSNAAEAGLDAYKAVFGGADMGGVGDGIADGTAEDIKNNPAVKDAAKQMVEDAWDEAIAATKTLDFSTIGKNMTGGIVEGIIAGTSDILKAVRDAINAAHKEAQLADDQHSPSRWWELFGLNETAGWAQGFEGGKANLLRAQMNLMDVVKSNALAYEFARQANAEIPLRTSYAALPQQAPGPGKVTLVNKNATTMTAVLNDEVLFEASENVENRRGVQLMRRGYAN